MKRSRHRIFDNVCIVCETSIFTAIKCPNFSLFTGHMMLCDGRRLQVVVGPGQDGRDAGRDE